MRSDDRLPTPSESGGTVEGTGDYDYDLTCWYINQRRVLESVDSPELAERLASIGSTNAIDPSLAQLRVYVALKDALIFYVRNARPPTLGQLALGDRVSPGLMFTHYARFYCRGLGKYLEAQVPGAGPTALVPRTGQPALPGIVIPRPPRPVAYPTIHCDIGHLVPRSRLQIQYDPAHLTSSSARVELSGQKRFLVVATVSERGESLVRAIPWVIASPVIRPPYGSLGVRCWMNYGEVSIGEVDSFEWVADEPPAAGISLPVKTPEDEVIRAFAEIIGEGAVPKHWGGERSDLYSARVRLQGKPIRAAFLFKGPSQGTPLTMGALGKNGDQMFRLFSEPADLFVLQHGHEITSPVVAHMRAMANQPGRPRLFMLIDGYDTVRILRAYGKCGFAATAERPGVSK